MTRAKSPPPSLQPRRRQHGKGLPAIDDSVGYKRPPKHKQYRPGISGNPRGRPKKRATLQDIVTDVLFEKIEVRVGERTRRITSVSALMRTTMNRAIKGDYKFVMAVIAFIRMSGLSDSNIDALVADIDTSADQAILADFIKRQGFVLAPRRSVPAKSQGSTKKSKKREAGDDSI
jgi:Family of unknown function (DUF5681)